MPNHSFLPEKVEFYRVPSCQVSVAKRAKLPSARLRARIILEKLAQRDAVRPTYDTSTSAADYGSFEQRNDDGFRVRAEKDRKKERRASKRACGRSSPVVFYTTLNAEIELGVKRSTLSSSSLSNTFTRIRGNFSRRESST